MLNWNDLRYFVAIARAGTLAAAAKELKVDQTTVGRRLAALEETLGAQLFVRTPDGFTLTTAGERAIALANDLDERIGSIEAKVRGTDDRPEGVVRVTTNENFGVGVLLARLLRVRERHPGIQLELLTTLRRVNLLRREADMAVRVAPRAPQDQQELIVRKIGTIGMSLYTTRAYLDAHPPVRPEDGLQDHDVILYEEELGDAPPGQWLAANARAGRPVLKTNSMLAAGLAASVGAGVALVPCMMTEMYPTLERVLPDNVLENHIWLVVHPDLHATARVRAVADHIIDELARIDTLLRGVTR